MLFLRTTADPTQEILQPPVGSESTVSAETPRKSPSVYERAWKSQTPLGWETPRGFGQPDSECIVGDPYRDPARLR